MINTIVLEKGQTVPKHIGGGFGAGLQRQRAPQGGYGFSAKQMEMLDKMRTDIRAEVTAEIEAKIDAAMAGKNPDITVAVKTRKNQAQAPAATPGPVEVQIPTTGPSETGPAPVVPIVGSGGAIESTTPHLAPVSASDIPGATIGQLAIINEQTNQERRAAIIDVVKSDLPPSVKTGAINKILNKQ